MLGILLAANRLLRPDQQLHQPRRGRRPACRTCRSSRSLLSLVVGFAFFAGITYAFVAIPSQTQLQEDLPEDVRGRVFGVLNMLVSVASFLPILIVGPIADLIGTTVVMLIVGLLVSLSGVASIIIRGPLKPAETVLRADVHGRDPIATALGAELPEGAYDDFDDEEDGVGPDGTELPTPVGDTVAASARSPPTRVSRQSVDREEAVPDAEPTDAPTER